MDSDGSLYTLISPTFSSSSSSSFATSSTGTTIPLPPCMENPNQNYNPNLSTHSSSFSSSSNYNSVLASLQSSSYSSSHKRSPLVLPNASFNFNHRSSSKRTRQRISDKTRSLLKLMPWDSNMDTATLFHQAYKYVRFLQSQILALHSMPLHSTFTVSSDNSPNSEFGTLGMLNRQQLLQVLLNSPAAQTMFYSHELCVFSVEQLILFNKLRVLQPRMSPALAETPALN
ncbi:hypothetical protein K2173_018723 [Erythroxylum novogranatense]|uniref:BHLH domain-containing protein n=1 Tax=Erythroxylum novogranatense TaxID=1862640 RepID=A0AAV8SAS1_9ROSI|nr:hypothetical protein K2173_018723 [Erythroxylum novogranatense]